MKKYIKLILLIFLIVTLSSCGDKFDDKMFDKLYEKNFEYASGLDNLSNPNTNYLILESNKINLNDVYLSTMWKEIETKYLENTDRVILAKYNVPAMKLFFGNKISVIECKTDELAQELYELMNTKEYLIKGNIIYICDYFGTGFVHGNPLTDDKFLYSDDILLFVDDLKENDEIIIGEKYKVICMGAFAKEVKKITLTNVEVIGSGAFFKNETLEEVGLNEGIKYIYPISFMSCEKLNNIKLPTTLKEIGKYAFLNCAELEYIVIPNNVDIIGELIFDNGIVFCESFSKPDKWDENFVDSNVTIYWGNEWEYNEEGIPTPIE